MNSNIIRILLALSILIISSYVQAADNSWFLGFSAGTAKDDKLNEDETGYKVYLGYRFLEHLSGEIAYVDFGKYFNATVDRRAVAAQATGILPISDHFDFFAKAGIYHWTIEFDLNPGTLTEDGGDFMYGVGLQANINKRLGIRAEYEEYLDLGDFDIKLLSLGVVYNF